MLRSLAARYLPSSVKQFIKRAFFASSSNSTPMVSRSDTPAVTLRDAPGITIRVYPGDIISDSIRLTGVWEPELSQKLVSLARIGGVMVEVGANIGYFSLLWAGLNENNQVYAFEPSPRNLDLLRSSINLNGLGQQIHVLPVAAGQGTSVAHFDLGPEEQTGWGGIVLASHGRTMPVVVVRLDDLFNQEIDILKIDVEGADTWVLEGCERLLQEKKIRRIFYEQNKPRLRALGLTEGQSEAFLEGLGYRVSPLTSVEADVVEWEALPVA